MPEFTTETHLLPGRLSEFRFQRFRLRVVDGPDRGSERVSEGAEFSIGSSPGNDLVLHDPTVSGHHCAIEVTPKGVLLRDLESTNGTQLAGYTVGFAYLKSGAIVGVGQTLLRFDHLKEEVTEVLGAEDWFGRVAGRSLAMRRIFAALPKIAGSQATVLIEGETGTGKGMLAEAIHQASPRAHGPFVVLDCGAIPPTLIESELFGHAKGAFTGAHHHRLGAFEAAQGGTIFLDEIGELPLEMQPNLLRAVEERTIRRIGSNEPVRLDVRIIAATLKDLRQAVNRGTFRSDLYYRLNIVRLFLPPLRERREDIPMLLQYFHGQIAPEGASLPAALVEAFSEHDWPGNVRELRSAVERAVLMEDPDLWREMGTEVPGRSPPSGAPTPADDAFDANLSFRAAKDRAVARWERWYIAELVKRCDGNLSRAARTARMDRTHLRELIRRYDVSIRDEPVGPK